MNISKLLRNTADRDALLVIDAQNDFLPGGALAVPNGNHVIPVINRIAKGFTNVVLTQDWHPAQHISFAASHPGKVFNEEIEISYGRQMLWPIHCLEGSHGAELSDELDIPHARLIIRKGIHRLVDSYSAFIEADRVTRTGLAGYLTDLGIKNVYVVGLATDFCVAWTALDAIAEGFNVSVIEDATRAIDINGSLANAWATMIRRGVMRIQSTDLIC
jgi:nicotinamidase/pyrazinamidase